MKKTATALLLSVFFLVTLLSLPVLIDAIGPVHSVQAATPSANITIDETDTTATVSGTISGTTFKDADGAVNFAYGLTTNYEKTPINVPVDAQLNFTFPITQLTPGTKYYYILMIYTNPLAPASSFSTLQGSTTTFAAPVGVSATAGDKSVTIKFSAVTPPTGRTIDHYYVVPTPNPDPNAAAYPSSKTTSITVNGLTNGTTYSFVVGATDDQDNHGPESSAVSATPIAGAGGDSTPGANDTTPQAGVLTIHLKLDNPLGETKTLPDLMLKILDGAILLLTPLVVIMLLYAGFLFVAARGNGEKLTEAKNVLMYTLIGAGIVVCAKGIAIVIQNTLVCIAGATNC